ncbi:MAG: hypothetical protein M1812_004478 [Candelaria pacifica]|nr:MAG: hypothetical protein M1812_004478 [Candelaria pacifica]
MATAPVQGDNAMSKLEKLQLMIGDQDMMSQTSDASEPDVEQAQEPSPEPDISTLNIFSGPDYRDDTIVPVTWGSDSEEEASFQPAPPPLPPKVDMESFTTQKKITTTPKKYPSTDTKTTKDVKKVTRVVELDSQVGRLSSISTTFCPVLAAAKYPYKYVTKNTQERVAKAFFAGGKFWERKWELYYIHPPSFISTKPLIFVPAKQVEQLIEEVNDFFSCQLEFPRDAEEVGFRLIFSDDNTPRPRYLGQSSSRSTFDNMVQNTPEEGYRPAEESSQTEYATDRSLIAFKRKIELGFEATKNRNKASKAKKKGERIQKQQSWIRQLKRIQRYLGLRECRSPTDGSKQINWGAVPGELSTTKEDSVSLELDITKVAPFLFEESIVFISVDVEAYERDHNLITEIGISTLDTLDLQDLPPGIDGKDWMAKIRARHFRVQEYSHLHNKDFVDGCGDRFEFGESEWISIKDTPQIIAGCFRFPFSAAVPTDTSVGQFNDASDDGNKKRNIILVGHDVSNDITFLQNLGYNPIKLANILEISDTASLFRALKRDQNPRALGTILYELGLIGWNLHNAGNDAAYTLQAMIAIAFRSLGATQGRSALDEEEMKKKVQDAVREAEVRVLEDKEGWSTEDDDDDGGVPVPIEQPKLGIRPGNADAKGCAEGSKGKRKADENHKRLKTEHGATKVNEVPIPTEPKAMREKAFRW